MSLRKTVVVTAGAWVVLISFLHAGMNLKVFQKTERREGSFKVGFLPVT